MTNLDQGASEPPAAERKAKPRIGGLKVIAVIKILKGILLTGLAVGFFRSINKDMGEEVRQLTFRLRIDPENTFVRLLLEKVAKVDPHTLRTIGEVTLVYAAELYVEGIGLWLNQAWAEYLLIVATGVFMPWEAKSCIVRFSWERLAVFLVNLGVLLYVIWVLWLQKRRKRE
jgi:uncharacterized membrane protein (DUF2068 family)